LTPPARVGQMLGKKNVRTDEPTERVDQKVEQARG
jgi:hypothetical protein